RALEQVGLLGAPDHGRAEVFVEARREFDAGRLQVFFRLPQLQIEATQRRSPVAGNEAGGIDAGGAVAHLLHQRQPHQCLHPGKVDATFATGVLVIERVVAVDGWRERAGGDGHDRYRSGCGSEPTIVTAPCHRLLAGASAAFPGILSDLCNRKRIALTRKTHTARVRSDAGRLNALVDAPCGLIHPARAAQNRYRRVYKRSASTVTQSEWSEADSVATASRILAIDFMSPTGRQAPRDAWKFIAIASAQAQRAIEGDSDAFALAEEGQHLVQQPGRKQHELARLKGQTEILDAEGRLQLFIAGVHVHGLTDM